MLTVVFPKLEVYCVHSIMPLRSEYLPELLKSIELQLGHALENFFCFAFEALFYKTLSNILRYLN